MNKRATPSACLLLLLGLVLAACGDGKSGGNNADMSLIPVKTGGKWGYIDHEGQYAINPQFDYAAVFREGRAVIGQEREGQMLYGFIDKEGNAAIPAQYLNATGFSDGVAWTVAEGGAPTAIAPDGSALFTLKQAREAYAYSEGLAWVIELHDDTLLHCTFYDTEGRKAIDLTGLEGDPWAAGGFSCGRFPVKDRSGRYGYIDREGKLAIPCQFDAAEPFGSNGLAIVKTGDKRGIIDRDGKYRINPQFNIIVPYGGSSVVRIGEGKWGYVDEEGKFLINPQFERALPFVGGDLAAATSDGELWGYIDREGKWAINPQFEAAFPFLGDIAPVSSSGDAWGFIGKDGKYCVNPQFEDLRIEYDYIQAFESVSSKYFDAEGTAARIVRKLEGGRLEGLDLATMTAGQFQDKFGLEGRNVQTYPPVQSGDCAYYWRIEGDLLRQEGGGWWPVYTLDRQARPSYVLLRANLRGNGEDHPEQFYQAVRKQLGTECGKAFGGKLHVALYGDKQGVTIYASARPLPTKELGEIGYEGALGTVAAEEEIPAGAAAETPAPEREEPAENTAPAAPARKSDVQFRAPGTGQSTGSAGEETATTRENSGSPQQAGTEKPAAQAETQAAKDDNKLYDRAEVAPQFPGGTAALSQYLSRNVNYPPVAIETGVQGRVLVRFVVEKDGSISSASVARSVDPALDKEALRVVRSMPRWKPGTQGGKPVRVKHTLPIDFQLQ